VAIVALKLEFVWTTLLYLLCQQKFQKKKRFSTSFDDSFVPKAKQVEPDFPSSKPIKNKATSPAIVQMTPPSSTSSTKNPLLSFMKNTITSPIFSSQKEPEKPKEKKEEKKKKRKNRRRKLSKRRLSIQIKVAFLLV